MGRLFVSFLVSKMKIGYRLISLMEESQKADKPKRRNIDRESLSEERRLISLMEKGYRACPTTGGLISLNQESTYVKRPLVKLQLKTYLFK